MLIAYKKYVSNETVLERTFRTSAKSQTEIQGGPEKRMKFNAPLFCNRN